MKASGGVLSTIWFGYRLEAMTPTEARRWDPDKEPSECFLLPRRLLMSGRQVRLDGLVFGSAVTHLLERFSEAVCVGEPRLARIVPSQRAPTSGKLSDASPVGVAWCRRQTLVFGQLELSAAKLQSLVATQAWQRDTSIQAPLVLLVSCVTIKNPCDAFPTHRKSFRSGACELSRILKALFAVIRSLRLMIPHQLALFPGRVASA